MADITIQKPELVKVDVLEFYCDRFKISEVMTVADESTPHGSTVITKLSRKPAKITFFGRTRRPERPMAAVQLMEALLGTGGHTVEYRGLIMRYCKIIGYTAEDSGKGYVDISLTIMTTSSMSCHDI